MHLGLTSKQRVKYIKKDKNRRLYGLTLSMPIILVQKMFSAYYFCCTYSNASHCIFHTILATKNKGTDQTTPMRRLVCAFVVSLQQNRFLRDMLNSFLARGDFCHWLITFTNRLDPNQDRQNLVLIWIQTV